MANHQEVRMKRIKNFFRGNLIWDLAATGLSVLFFEFLYVFGKVSGGVNWEMVIFDSITGIVSFWTFFGLVFLIFKIKSKPIEFLIIVHLVIFASAVWALCHSAYITYFDWLYLSDIRPETFYERNIKYLETAFSYFTPIFSIISLIFIGLLRIVKKIIIDLLELKLN